MTLTHLHQALFTTELKDGIPPEEITYNVFIDYEGVLAMAKKAAKRKNRRCVDGPLVVRIYARKPLEGAPMVNVHIVARDEKPELGGADQ